MELVAKTIFLPTGTDICYLVLFFFEIGFLKIDKPLDFLDAKYLARRLCFHLARYFVSFR